MRRGSAGVVLPELLLYPMQVVGSTRVEIIDRSLLVVTKNLERFVRLFELRLC